MNITTSTVLTFTLVTAGRWSEGKGIELNVAIAAVTLGVILTVLAGSNEAFAEKVGLLIVVAAVFRYVPTLVKNAKIGK